MGWRQVTATGRRTARDVAAVPRWLVEGRHPRADKLALVTDALNTHDPGCRCEALEPERARRIAEPLGWQDTPRHGSWVSVAACESAAPSGQCLDRRIGSATRRNQVVGAWVKERSARKVGVNWRFTTADARVKLRRLDPAPQKC